MFYLNLYLVFALTLLPGCCLSGYVAQPHETQKGDRGTGAIPRGLTSRSPFPLYVTTFLPEQRAGVVSLSSQLFIWLLKHKFKWHPLHWNAKPPCLYTACSLVAGPSAVLDLAQVWHQITSGTMSLTVVINTPWVTASPWNRLLILEQCEQMRWNTHCRSLLKSAARQRCCGGWCDAVFPHSPRGAKARQATITRRENGCAWCSNRWEESSVPVR